MPSPGPWFRIRHLREHLAPLVDRSDVVAADGLADAAAPAPAAASEASEGARRQFPSAAQRAHFEEHGYCVADDALDPALLPKLLAASRRVRDRVRSGALTHGFMHRTGREVGFAPHPEPWGIRGLFSPIHGEPVFADYIGHEHLARYIRGFTGTAKTEELGLGTTVLFTNPRDDDYTIGWHRYNPTLLTHYFSATFRPFCAVFSPFFRGFRLPGAKTERTG
eukprot:COSAG04_NODE_7608_length_1098_cov_1.418418_1_plen_221_part_01